MAQKKVVILGGNGFIGSEICREAHEQGYRVISVSRKGRPPRLKAGWANQIEWVAADVFDLPAWQNHLTGCQAVVHSIAIIREKPETGLTFERLIAGSVQVAARAAEEAGVEKFVFLSVKSKPPVVSPRFLTAKREAEAGLKQYKFKTAILQPALVYGPARPPTPLVGFIWKGLAKLPGVGPGLKQSLPLSTAQVARASVKALDDLQITGILDIAAIKALAGPDPQ